MSSLVNKLLGSTWKILLGLIIGAASTFYYYEFYLKKKHVAPVLEATTRDIKGTLSASAKELSQSGQGPSQQGPSPAASPATGPPPPTQSCPIPVIRVSQDMQAQHDLNDELDPMAEEAIEMDDPVVS